MRFDRNPLRRATDRAESVVLILLAVLFLVGAPLSALAAGAGLHAVAQRTEVAQHASRYQVTARIVAVTGAPTSGNLKGLAMVYDRMNNSTLKMAGNPSSNITGAFYLASGTLLMSGTPAGTINTQIVVGDLAMNGNNSGLTMTYSGGGAPDQVPKLYLSR